MVEESKETFGEEVKFSSQQDENNIECQGNDNEGNADIEGKGEEKDIELGKDPGENAENQTGEEQYRQDRGAKEDPQGEHMRYQFHQIGNGIAREVQFAGGEQFVGAYRGPQEMVVTVQGQKDQDRKDVLELRNQGDLAFALGIEDIRGGKAHLVADDRGPEFHRSEDQAGDKTDEGAQEGLVDNQQEKGDGGKTNGRCELFHNRKEDQGDGDDETGFEPDWGLSPGDNRDSRDKARHPGSDHQKGLELF